MIQFQLVVSLRIFSLSFLGHEELYNFSSKRKEGRREGRKGRKGGRTLAFVVVHLLTRS